MERPNSPDHSLALLVPRPWLSPRAARWLPLAAVDLALIGLNWLLIGALLLLFPPIRMFEDVATPPAFLLGLALLHAALITLMGYNEGLYAADGDLRQRKRMLGKSVLWATGVMGFAYGLQASLAISAVICAAGLLNFYTLLMWRWREGGQQADIRDRRDARNVLIVGAGSVGQRVASYVEAHPEAGRSVYGFVDDDRPLGGMILGRLGDLARLARTGFVDEVILAAPHDRETTWSVLREARRLRLDVEMVPELFGCEPAATEVEPVGDLPTICLHAERLPLMALVFKRVVDVVGAGIGLALMSPFLPVIAGLIKLDSPGSVLYGALRAGRKSRVFRCYKFRTVVDRADQLKNGLRDRNQRSGPIFKIGNDPRITRVGRFLRRYSLDELPQLWNVLKGEMSLVGPRPHPVDEFAAYEIEHLARLDVTPGITGLWQVSARRDPSFRRSIELDREYIRTWNLMSDMRILLRTVLAVIGGSGQ
jgi:exopolysaccharide biosynthesis polyprenyl glycosylphosphotransferase